MNEDREISEGLRRLGRQDWQPPGSGAAAAVRAARRRTGARVAGLVAAVATIVLAVPVALSQEPVAAPVPPAASTDVTPSPTAGTTTTPAPEPTVGPADTAVPEPSRPPVIADVDPALAPLVVEDPATGAATAGTLVGLRVRALETGSSVLDGAGSGVGSGGTSWLADPCGDGPPATDDARTGFFSGVVPGDVAPVFQGATYPDAETAARVVQEVADEVVRCQAGLGTVWRLWDAPAPEGVVVVVSYDVAEDVAEGVSPLPQYGQVYRFGVDGSTVVASGFGSLYGGTGIAYALGDTRPGVGPADWGLTREEVQADVDGVTSSWSDLRQDMAAHLAEGGQEAPQGVGFPVEAAPEHGGRVWAVFVAVARDPGDERLDRALRDLATVGYDAGVGELACSQGATEVLGLDPARTYFGVSVWFASAAEARQMVDAFEPGVVGTAEVVTYCLD